MAGSKDRLKEIEKQRSLTEAEKRRVELFNDTCMDLERQGYRGTELTVSIVKANVFALVFGIPVLCIGIGLFLMRFGAAGMGSMTFRELLIWLIGLFVMIVLHEFIHGFTWGLYAEHYFKDIEFGFIRKYMTPYCTCTVPLRKREYILGALMPLIVLGILPTVASMFNGSFIMLFSGLIMTISAAGDILIVREILKHGSKSDDVLYMDHPTMAGGMMFER
ncbi:MAG: DUF3267 domain-containing protein [Eubacterium sp.]|nr:DUF3267 domain-containing protein [Eubacterium sp.]